MAQAWQTAHEDPSYLSRGGRLTQIHEWANQNPANLNNLEQRFLVASQEMATQEELEREVQQQRELDQTKRLVDAQAQQVKVTRRALAIISLLFVVAIGIAIFAFAQTNLPSDKPG